MTGADEAESKTEDLTDSYAGMGEQATAAAGSAGFLGGTLSDTADETKDAEEAAQDADTQFTLLQGTIAGIGGGVSEVLGSTGLSGIGGLITGGVALGKLVKKANFGTLIKSAAALGPLIVFADTLTDVIDGKAPLTAFVDSVEDLGELVLNPIGIKGDLVEGVTGIGAFIGGLVSVGSYLTGVPITTMITTAASGLVSGGVTLATFLGAVSLGTLIGGTAGFVTLLTGIVSLGDLVDGDISDWNLPAKFGKALGEGFERAWPDIAETIRTGFTNNPAFDAGQRTREVAEGDEPLIDPEATSFSPGLDLVSGLPLGQTGGRVGQTGAAVIHEDEQLIDPSTAEIIRSGGGMRGGGGDRAGDVNVENITVNLDGDFDPSDVTRRDLDSLADRLADRIGANTNRRAGVR